MRSQGHRMTSARLHPPPVVWRGPTAPLSPSAAACPAWPPATLIPAYGGEANLKERVGEGWGGGGGVWAAWMGV